MKKNETNSAQHNEHGIMDAMHEMNRKMDSTEMTGNVDHDFAEMMIIHHQAAIEMAQTELDSGNDAKLKNLATRIIEDQAKEIKEMQQWLKSNTE